MHAKILVDTNILAYAYDRSEAEKQKLAFSLLERLTVLGSGVISAQIMAEFFVVVTRKLNLPLSVADAYQRLENYQQSWVVLEVTPAIVLEAVRGMRNYQFSYWDAQIWATARLNQIPIIFSEDFNVGAVIEGVRFVNPFAVEFDLESWFVT